MTQTEIEMLAKQSAFNIIKKHPECLRDDEPLQGLIDDIAAAIVAASHVNDDTVGRLQADVTLLKSGVLQSFREIKQEIKNASV